MAARKRKREKEEDDMGNNTKKAAFMTLGCKVNQYETDAMIELLSEAGYEIVDFSQEADVYVINTCSVTNIADRKSRQMIHRARKRNPDALVVAAGCYVQSDTSSLEEEGDVDILIGNNRKNKLVPLLEEAFTRQEKTQIADVPDMTWMRDYEKMELTKVTGHTRAYVKIQDGCDQFCSYCIIPYTRGRVRSKAPDDVLSEIRKLVASGYREIVLTGIHLDSYGKDLEGIRLIDIIEKIDGISGLERLRLGSLEPRIITESFLKRLVKCTTVCPHFHLSLQSGCDETLKRMNRKYTSHEYEEAVKLLRQYYRSPAITTDVIAGFVGETEEEFAATLSFLDRISLYETHVFKYSVRSGTLAQKMPGHLTDRVKSERVAALMELAKEKKRQYETAMIGTKKTVLIEEEKIIDGKKYYQGYTDNYVRILVESDDEKGKYRSNCMVMTEITGFLGGKSLFGKISIEF